MLPSILVRQLQKGLGDYIETTFPMMNAPFAGSVRGLLSEKGAVYREPYVAVRLPFRTAGAMPSCFAAIHPSYFPYVHQARAFERLTGEDGRSTLVATGTGSGKTECFLYPILEYCYRHRGERGIKALIIYPMNALATDQAKRLAELIYESGELRGNVTAGMYVGGREEAPSRVMSEHGIITDHETMLAQPPDILLTNYKMLDYLLVRPKDAALWQDNGQETLKYIAVDELHTFDGAQGTDLACLLRRLKYRLGIPGGYLCCIGTSATMGDPESGSSILSYAGEIFGEPFEKDAFITEDRLSAEEFFEGAEATEFAMPSEEAVLALKELAEADEASAYIRRAIEAWLPGFPFDAESDEGRLRLSDALMHHSFMQAVIELAGGRYYQTEALAEELRAHYPALSEVTDAAAVIDSLYALISHARTGAPGKLRPFLTVQVQLWMRELRRLVAKVDGEKIRYELARELNAQQAKQYLPVVNCRDCGLTGWVSILNERGYASLRDLDSFYNLYFRADGRISMMFPDCDDSLPEENTTPAHICPECMRVVRGDMQGSRCPDCDAEMVAVRIPKNDVSGTKANKQYVCPCCGSRRGLALMGLRSATEISASISQLFASKFNDDKKTLAFSDNVQDAAHRAGFFNARTWRFGLRTAIRKYCAEEGAGKSLSDFQDGFIRYWHGHMTEEDFVSFFIAPNMTWMHAYEDMVERRRFGTDVPAKNLMRDIERRIRYEIMLEFGLAGKIGRTLEKAGCAVLAFDETDIREIAEAVRMRAVNELGTMTGESADAFCRMAIGCLNRIRMGGAFEDRVFEEYAKNGKPYMLSNDRVRWLPGLQSGRNTPHFPAVHFGKGRPSNVFDAPSEKKYTGWVHACCSDPFIDEGSLAAVSRFIWEEAEKRNVLLRFPSAAEYAVYGLNKERVRISDRVVQMRCSHCGAVQAVAEEDRSFWEGAPCLRTNCAGTLTVSSRGEIGYYGHLYSTGDMERVNASEHTGLLDRGERERLETDFKRGKDTRELWDPNVLSCTPTLEMGIDIGDLSTVILCSMPPAQSQFLQRAGRAGRKDGNALTLAVANARPHDLYFYADPLEMIAGEVTPPKIFLRASAVLERQFVAFCMDSWVKRGLSEGAIPETVGSVLNKLDGRPSDMFPFNFLNYVQGTLSRQLRSFRQMFLGDLDEETEKELEVFARGRNADESPMYIKILDAFEGLGKQKKSLRAAVDALEAMIKELKDKPQDSSFEEEIRELESEKNALLNVLREIGRKNIFNFLSDEGLLPNYAFPEAGIILRALLYRKSEEGEPKQGGKYEKMAYEYSRSASSAISEFAPNNSFYADGRKLTIDQVDLTTAQSAKWRLCPNCSHAELEESGKHTAACPQCGSPAWADVGQVRNMLKVQMVYSNMDYTKSQIDDKSDDRNTVFYCKQLLVDVDEEHDIQSAYQMDNQEFPFGYEFVSKATLREINFGESDLTGEKFFVSGVEEVRKGFRICKYCGKIQPDTGKANHTFSCKARKIPELASADAYEECLFLYREFSTEILRLLIPATTMAATSVRQESFVAAFMLGMKEYFGNVDHLRAAVCEVPVPDAEYRKQYLVIYDSVPGGTGYLKQLMHKENALIEIFERALHVMESCSCKDEPGKDGCYHCLYAYRQSQQIGNISRTVAVQLLKAILSGKDGVKRIGRLGDISANPLFDSELEQRFMEAVRTYAGADEVRDIIRNGKHSYYLKLGDMAWEIEPQVDLAAEDGVAVKCRPDFVFWPVSESSHKAVAVFTDGFRYHKDIAADDTLKREAIRRSGNFRVWALSYKDVRNVFVSQGEYYTETLASEKMPSGAAMYQPLVKKCGAESLAAAKLSSIELLFEYLKRSDAEKVFEGQAKAYAFSLLDQKSLKNRQAFERGPAKIRAVNEELYFTDQDLSSDKTLFGEWIPGNSESYMAIYAGIPRALMKNASPTVCAFLDDGEEKKTDVYEREWNGFWRFWNVMQFAENFAAVSADGLKRTVYAKLPLQLSDVEIPAKAAASEGNNAWNAVMELLFDEEAKQFAKAARAKGISAPEEDGIGYEIAGEDGEVIASVEIAWPAVKVGFMTEEQKADREMAEAAGWRIISLKDIPDLDAAEFLEGKDK